ncbi:Domain of uncharacterised function (DUF2825) [Klebsiella pneumoniae subsp. pneumoniae]|nr:Domain of uncharacterised function (DUF2825) [Klebsiella pneumoniae subsp. pneumoniae]VED55657.1 Domain of uncharacterised function (DUF2825) [Klebsiella aerogenes]
MRSSPRTWGCFSRNSPLRPLINVFPTHVGVFPKLVHAGNSGGSLPHARGGVSQRIWHTCKKYRSSPRTWGCFPVKDDAGKWVIVFPTHVGVFLDGELLVKKSIRLPHARGGVSPGQICLGWCRRSSPRTWGCFLNLPHLVRQVIVFPTHVGVFPTGTVAAGDDSSLPHARGGVSTSMRTFLSLIWSSPRTWGCF